MDTTFIYALNDPESGECRYIGKSDCPTKTRFKMRKKREKASSPFFGVYKTRPGKWRAKIHVSGKNIFLGTFSSEVEAAQAYDIAAKKHHGEFAKLNFPG